MRANTRVGMRVTLFLSKDEDRKAEKKPVLTLPSIVEELPDEETILIQMPMYHGHFYPLPRERVFMRFFVESIPYAVPVQYEDRVAREGFVLARLKRCGPVEKHQTRESFRTTCSLPVQIERENGEDDAATTGVALNISEGGMLLATNETLALEETITASFDIGTHEIIRCVVVRTEKAVRGNYLHRVGLMFRYQELSQSDRIYKYVLNAQRKQARRERG